MEKTERKSLPDIVNNWISENGAAFRKIPYLRKKMEEEKCKLSGVSSLKDKLSLMIKEYGFSFKNKKQSL